MATLEDSCWVSSPFAPQSPEAAARSAMKFVKVATVDGYLTDISISMILVEMKRMGLRITNGERNSG